MWGTRGNVALDVPRVSDQTNVERISTLLEPAGRIDGHPRRLAENVGVAFEGCKPYGSGFVLPPEEANEWLDADPENAKVLFPYLTGEDLNSRPDTSPSRWVIDFYDRSEAAVKCYKLPYARLLGRVKPERQKVNRKVLRERWWQYGEKRPAMRKATATLNEVLVLTIHSKAVMPMRVPTGNIFSHGLGIFATDSFASQAVLSSGVHQTWAIAYGSTLEARVRYTHSDVFETFPRPEPSERLSEAGKTLDSERREIMLRRNLGLTKLYNLVNDPDITHSADPDVTRIRQIHVELDEAVMAAYGWGDVPLEHGFHTYRQMRRWTVSPTARVEILDRLLEENHRREPDRARCRPRPRPTKSRGRRSDPDERASLPRRRPRRCPRQPRPSHRLQLRRTRRRRRSRSTRPTPAVTGSRPRSTVRNAPVWIDTAHGTQK